MCVPHSCCVLRLLASAVHRIGSGWRRQHGVCGLELGLVHLDIGRAQRQCLCLCCWVCMHTAHVLQSHQSASSWAAQRVRGHGLHRTCFIHRRLLVLCSTYAACRLLTISWLLLHSRWRIGCAAGRRCMRDCAALVGRARFGPSIGCAKAMRWACKRERVP